jgi:hypothetical protein
MRYLTWVSYNSRGGWSNSDYLVAAAIGGSSRLSLSLLIFPHDDNALIGSNVPPAALANEIQSVFGHKEERVTEFFHSFWYSVGNRAQLIVTNRPATGEEGSVAVLRSSIKASLHDSWKNKNCPGRFAQITGCRAYEIEST